MIAGNEAILGSYARSDSNCAALEPPPIVLERPPSHGVVCLRGDDVFVARPEENNLTQCIARKIRGVKVFYLARKGYAGDDRVLFIVQYPTVKRSVEIELHVLIDEFLAKREGFANTYAPADGKQQTPGAIPLCAH